MPLGHHSEILRSKRLANLLVSHGFQDKAIISVHNIKLLVFGLTHKIDGNPYVQTTSVRSLVSPSFRKRLLTNDLSVCRMFKNTV